ncbi:hypothetical protein [Streptomyces sp. V4I2]|uniref:SCO2400 family protein n=1 Tax=Streptomyces sp. V4I2 TaxID=3042280 RepID=UPI0027812993|nr:hypothetical protein [Streptomyces sp. V4I2]MDQ1047193.1 hypothetical protein [Streptomyces sp. V4I2]
MDYCSTCRRHLNGALVCPGCGAYAPDIAPTTAGGRIVPAPATTVTSVTTGAAAASEPMAFGAWHGRDGRLRHEVAAGGGMDEVPQSDPTGGPEGGPSAPQGRAARRRQRARWKKNQRKAVVATAVALIGGGLTLASMDRQSGDRTQAATAPKDPAMGAVEEQAAQDARPTSTQPDIQRSSPTSPAQSPASDRPGRQQATASLPTTPPNTRPDAAAPPRTTEMSQPQPQTTAPSSDGTVSDRTDTADSTSAQTPAPAATGGSDSTESGTSPASTAPATTSPPQVCLLVLCIG